MKQPERVAELLAELRALAENDFERHRIDVLERDLTAPPTVEIVDDTHQRFDGIEFKMAKAKGHYINTTLAIHRVVWSYYHGEIPAGYVIHHIDENKANNRIENLQALTPSDHRRAHKKDKTQICPVCNNHFIPKRYQQICCSPACAQIYRTKIPEKKICPICGKFFANRKHGDQIYCSISCASKIKNKKPALQKVCPVCGTLFILKRNKKTVCCSRRCGAILAHRTKKANSSYRKGK